MTAALHRPSIITHRRSHNQKWASSFCFCFLLVTLCLQTPSHSEPEQFPNAGNPGEKKKDQENGFNPTAQQVPQECSCLVISPLWPYLMGERGDIKSLLGKGWLQELFQWPADGGPRRLVGPHCSWDNTWARLTDRWSQLYHSPNPKPALTTSLLPTTLLPAQPRATLLWGEHYATGHPHHQSMTQNPCRGRSLLVILSHLGCSMARHRPKALVATPWQTWQGSLSFWSPSPWWAQTTTDESLRFQTKSISTLTFRLLV